VTVAVDGSEDFLSGTSGQVLGIRASTRALVRDALDDAVRRGRLEPLRLRRAARAWPRRRILALGIERPDQPNLLAGARAELLRSGHEVEFVQREVGGRGRFQNLNEMVAQSSLDGRDWLLVVDDDVALPAGFLDVFVFLAERFGLRLAQPAHRARSHAAWDVTRRRAGSLARETRFVEIGPVVGFHATTFEAVLPFPDLRIGWCLDLHWSALAESHGWPIGVIDALGIRHGLRQIASSYDRGHAVAEAREFLRNRAYVPAREAQTTLVTHTGWR
jgi:hypothetical protein